jgi:hypothetical protein
VGVPFIELFLGGSLILEYWIGLDIGIEVEVGWMERLEVPCLSGCADIVSGSRDARDQRCTRKGDSGTDFRRPDLDMRGLGRSISDRHERLLIPFAYVQYLSFALSS